MTLHIVVLSFHVFFNSGLVQFLIGMWVFRVNVDLVISEYDAFRRIFIENNVKWDLLGFCCCEEIMSLHLLPA